MFGPNVRSAPAPGHAEAPYYHHRGASYHELLRGCVHLFRARFNVSEEFDILFLSGSGTFANEATAWSLLPTAGVRITSRGEFSYRLSRLLLTHHRGRYNATTAPPSATKRWGTHWWMVQYETAEARPEFALWPLDEASLHGGLRLADCVSSFPYYDPPPGVDVWTTVTSKQLGAYPVMSVVVIRKTAWDAFREAGEYSIFNLRRYQDAYATKAESPHTPSIALLADTHQRLEGFSVKALRKTVDERRDAIWALTLRYNVDGHVMGKGPVVRWAPTGLSAALANRWGLYHGAEDTWQAFLYSGTDAEWETFLTEWRRELSRRPRETAR